MKVRRVVTGHDGRGKAVFAADGPVEPITVRLFPGMEMHQLWGADATPSFPDDGSLPPFHAYFPAVGGFRFMLVTLPPDAAASAPDPDLDLAAAAAEVEERMPGLAGHMEPDEPGMHTTATVDFEVILAGELVLELDDGAEVVLRPGDTVVQNGTRHRWRNEGDVPATMAVFMVGAHHSGVGG